MLSKSQQKPKPRRQHSTHKTKTGLRVRILWYRFFAFLFASLLSLEADSIISYACSPCVFLLCLLSCFLDADLSYFPFSLLSSFLFLFFDFDFVIFRFIVCTYYNWVGPDRIKREKMKMKQIKSNYTPGTRYRLWFYRCFVLLCFSIEITSGMHKQRAQHITQLPKLSINHSRSNSQLPCL